VLDAGVVHEDVHTPELRCSGLHHVLDIGCAAHVGAVVGHLDTCRLTGGQHLGAWAVHIAKTIEHDVGALAGEGLGDAQTNATGGAGNECGFAFEHGSLSE